MIGRELLCFADKFSEGWHDGIEIDATEMMLLVEIAAALEQPERQEPVAWVKLTDEEIASIFTSKDATWWKPFARAIEAALKEKNT